MSPPHSFLPRVAGMKEGEVCSVQRHAGLTGIPVDYEIQSKVVSPPLKRDELTQTNFFRREEWRC